MTRRLVISAWLGFALAALFFYPLAVALQADMYYLQWQPRHVAELAAVLAALGLLIAVALFVLWPRSSRSASLALIAIATIPLASFVAGVSRQLPFDDLLRAAWENRGVRLALPSALAACVTVSVVLWPKAFNRWFRRLLIVLSPVSLLVFGSIIASAFHVVPTIAVDRAPGSAGARPGAECAPVLALLFDELSFSYLYDENGHVRTDYPEIGRLSAEATNYLDVAAPARETLISMPSFLAARHLRDIRIEDGGIFEVTEDGRLQRFSVSAQDGLFATARRLGFTTEMAGYYLPYCDLLGNLVDACRSMSFYNVSTTSDGFSLAGPVLTTLVLFPRQFPFGLLKNPPFARLQRKLVDVTAAFARRPMQGARPVFRFVHFSVPHLPFVFDAAGYAPPLNPLQTSPDTQYVRQLRFVDRLFGELAGQMRREGTYERATIVLLADHGFRFGGREANPLQIPFIAKMARQTSRVDIATAVQGERLLKQVLERSCEVQ